MRHHDTLQLITPATCCKNMCLMDTYMMTYVCDGEYTPQRGVACNLIYPSADPLSNCGNYIHSSMNKRKQRQTLPFRHACESREY